MNNDELIKQYCKKLRWGSSLHKNYKEIESLDHADFLAQLLKLEIDQREL